MAIIREATSEADYAAFGALVREYVEWCRQRYAADPWVVETAFGYQSLDRELGLLREAYGPPKGRTLLAVEGDAVLGCVAYRDLGQKEQGQGACEMKRMFVPARFHGKGLGKLLCDALIDQARADGYSLMRLDTAKAFAEAIGLYQSAGFAECAPYIDYPERLKAMLVFMERRLG